MNRLERQNDQLETLRTAMEGKQAEIWTALPGIIESFDPEAITATVQPAIKGIVYNAIGKAGFVDLPLLLDVPVEFPSGGGFTLTFPVEQGDECVVEFQSRCIDAWWQAGGVQPPLELRMHDLSDAICRVGVRSQKRRLSPAVSTKGAQLRTDDGEAHVTMLPDYTIRAENPAASVELTPAGEVNAVGQSKVSIQAPLVEIVCGGFSMRSLEAENELTAEFRANIRQDGWIESTGDHTAGNISLKKHRNTGVQTGNGISGGPV